MKDQSIDLRIEPYAEEDELLNDYVKFVNHQIVSKMVKDEESWLYRAGEVGRFPQIKGADEFYNAFTKAFEYATTWLYTYLVEKYLRDIRLQNINLGEEMEYELSQLMDKEYYEKWEAKAKKYIFDEYAKYIGESEAMNLFYDEWPGWER